MTLPPRILGTSNDGPRKQSNSMANGRKRSPSKTTIALDSTKHLESKEIPTTMGGKPPLKEDITWMSTLFASDKITQKKRWPSSKKAINASTAKYKDTALKIAARRPQTAPNKAAEVPRLKSKQPKDSLLKNSQSLSKKTWIASRRRPR